MVQSGWTWTKTRLLSLHFLDALLLVWCVCVCVCVFKCDRYLFYISYSMGRLGLIQQVKEIVCLIPCRRTPNTPPLNIFMKKLTHLFALLQALCFKRDGLKIKHRIFAGFFEFSYFLFQIFSFKSTLSYFALPV